MNFIVELLDESWCQAGQDNNAFKYGARWTDSPCVSEQFKGTWTAGGHAWLTCAITYAYILGLQVQFHDSDLHLHSEFIAPGTVVCDSTSGSVSGSDCIDLFNAVEASICWQVADPKVCTANKAVSGTLSAYVSLLQPCYAFNPYSQTSSQHTLQQYSLEQLAVCCCIVVSRNSIRTSLNQALGKDG